MKNYYIFFVAILLISFIVPVITQAQTPFDNLRNFLTLLQWKLSGQINGNGLHAAPRPIGDSGIHLPEDATIFQEVQPATNLTLINQAPAISPINASSLSITLPDRTVNLNATITDDLLPSPHAVRATWAQVGGSGISFEPVFNQSALGSFLANTIATLPPIAGTYTIKLTASDGALMSAVRTVNIILNPFVPNQAPTANISASPNPIIVGENVNFSGAGSTDPDGMITGYSWNFGDGTVGAGVNTNHSYLTAGFYQASLIVTDDDGATDDDTVVINVVMPNLPPIADAGPDQSVEANTIVSFTGQASTDPEGDALAYTWNFGDGMVAGPFSLPNTAHIYSTPATYDVTLTVTDPGGLSDTDETLITVNPADPCANNVPPTANAGPDQTVQVQTVVNFSGSASTDPDLGDTLTYTWNFGDGQMATGVNSSHVYTTANTYLVTLTVSDGCMSQVDTMNVVVNSLPGVNHPPTADAGPDQNVNDIDGNGSHSVVLSGIASFEPDSGQTLTYAWRENNVLVASGSQPQLILPVGTHYLTLQVTDNGTPPLTSVPDEVIVTVISAACVNNQSPVVVNELFDRWFQTGYDVFFGGTSPFSDPENHLTSYRANFGDGEAINSPIYYFLHPYPTPSDYVATLTAFDDCNLSVSTTWTTHIVPINPGPLNILGLKIQRLLSANPLNGSETWEELIGNPATVDLKEHLRVDILSNTGDIGLDIFDSPEVNLGFLTSSGLARFARPPTANPINNPSYDLVATIYDPSFAQTDTETRQITVRKTMTFLDALPLADDNSNDIALNEAGTLAWTSHFNGVLTTLDISNPNAMQVLGTINSPTARAIAASNGHVYLASTGAGLQTYTDSTPTPTYVSTYNTSAQDGQNVKDVIAINKIVFMAAGPAGLKVINMSNPAVPVSLGAITLAGNASAENLAIANGKAYVADGNFGSAKIHIFDISMFNPANPQPGTPVLLKTIMVDWLVQQLSVTGNTLVAMASPGGMFLYDVSNPLDPNPNQVGYFDIAGLVGLSPAGIIALGNRVYATFGNVLSIGSSVAKINIADPVHSYIMEWLPTTFASGANRGPVLHDSKLFMANSNNKAVSVGIEL